MSSTTCSTSVHLQPDVDLVVVEGVRDRPGPEQGHVEVGRLGAGRGLNLDLDELVSVECPWEGPGPRPRHSGLHPGRPSLDMIEERRPLYMYGGL